MLKSQINQPSFTNVDADELYVCPYDSVHRVSAKRFPIHLSKCRKLHNAKDFVSCPFNARHEVPRQELQYHVTTCPDKEVIRQDIEPVSDYVSVSSNRPPTPPPTQGIMHEQEEDWDTEAVCEAFIPSNAHKFDDADKVDSYAVVQSIHEMQSELHADSRAPQVDISQMTPVQRKNYKRSLKRQQKRTEETTEEEEPQMTEQERIDALVKQYHITVDGGGFVDFISGLNIYCQQHKVNIPKYQEGPGVAGGFGSKCIVRTSVYATNKHCKTKKEAKQNSAMVAILALDIQFDSGPLPNRKNTPLTTKERERMRQTDEQKLLLQSSQAAGRQQPKPILQPPSSFTSPPVASNVSTVNHVYSPPPGFQNLQQPMENLSIQSQEPTDDGWTTVQPKKTGAKGVNPVFEYSMKVAGRGRGRGLK